MSHPETVPNTASINYLELPPDAQEALSAVIPERPVVNAASLREQVVLTIARQDVEGRTTIPDTFTDEAPPAPLDVSPPKPPPSV